MRSPALILLALLAAAVSACSDEKGGHDAAMDGGFEDVPVRDQDARIGPNLIANPEVSDKDPAEDRPAGWKPDSWGTLEAKLSWVDVDGGGRAVRTEILDYTEGDAKWMFDRVPLKAGSWYEYADLSRSDGRARMYWSCLDPSTNKRTYNSAWQSDQSDGWMMNLFRFYVPADYDCMGTILHLLDRIGWVETRSHDLYEVRPPSFDKGYVSVTFDDISKTAVTMGAPEMNGRKIAGTFYVVTKDLDRQGGDYVSSGDVRSLYEAGHEIGTHGNHHVPMTTLSDDELKLEMTKSKGYLDAIGVYPVGISYPFGDFDGRVENAALGAFRYARSSLDGHNDDRLSLSKLRIIPVTNVTETGYLLARINDAAATSTWIILLFHKLSETPVPDDEYVTTMEQFRAVMDRLARGDVAVMPVKEVLKATGWMKN
jgi:peptidoglycan/xylan/chitin deacetylase (PgdA/CDA1 family)